MGGKLSKEELNEALNDQLHGSDVLFLPKSDEDDAYHVLADAFKEAPLVAWVAGLEKDDPERGKKIRQLGKSMIAYVNHRLINGSRGVALGVKGTPELAGCMTLVPSSCERERLIDTMTVMFKYGAPPIYKSKEKSKYGPHSTKRMEKLSVLGNKKRKEHMRGTGRWVYLQTIGVLSTHHGKGYGKKMLQLLVRAADALEASIYLETTYEGNESLYHHFGFRTLERLNLSVAGDETPTANLTVYLMRKDPSG